MNVRRLAAWVALPVAMAVGISACGSGDSGSDNSSGGGTVTVGIGEPEHLLPGNTVESNGAQIDVALFTPLLRFKDDGSADYSQGAAESITSTDKKVWTVKLKDGMTFHNGQKVTADSYIKAWNYTAYGPNAQIGADPFFTRIAGFDDMQGESPKAKELSGVKKVDDQTIEITLAAPFVEFEKVLGYTVFDPLPDVAFAADGTLSKTYEDAPVGNGPFKMSGSWDHNQGISVVRYDDYKLDKPKVQQIDFKIYQDQVTMYNDLIAGNLDVQPQIPSDKLASAATDLGDRLMKSPSSYFGFISLPVYDAAYTGRSARHSPWRSTARRSSTRSSRVPTRRPPASSRRSCRAPATTPVATPASSTRPRPRPCTPRPVACQATRSTCTTTLTVATRSGSTRSATRSPRTSR